MWAALRGRQNARMPPRGTKRVAALAEQNERLERELTRRVAELERERDFIATVVDSTSTLFSVLDTEGLVVRYNTPLARLGGVEDRHVRGLPFWDVFVIPGEAADFRRRLYEDDGVEHEHAFRRGDGSTAIVAWAKCGLVDGDGQPRILLSGVDVTERKREREELRASRARIVHAADAARRRIERDLHDGAQQRLVGLALDLRLARTAVREGDERGAARRLETLEVELAHALDELRELARGIHPTVLTERGLPEALESLAVRSSVPVEIEQAPSERLPLEVEAAVYFVVAEALTNVAKYAQGRVASVRVFCEDGAVVAEIEDDGIGGAEVSGGSGLRGLSDRIEVLEGTLSIESPRGGPTFVRAMIPVEAR